MKTFYIEYNEDTEYFEVHEITERHPNGMPKIAELIAVCYEEGNAERIVRSLNKTN